MTQIKVLIRTPKGHAKKTEYSLRPFLIGNKGKIHKLMTNETDDQILWIVDANPREYLKIIKNVGMYKTMISGILNNKTVRKLAKLSPEDEAELNHMLSDQTQIDIVKENEWETIKKEFKEI